MVQVVLGDPYRGQAITGIDSSNIKTFCNVDDLICDGLPLPLPSHLTYGSNADEAAAFVKQWISV